MDESSQTRAQTLHEHMGVPSDEPITFRLFGGEHYLDAILRASAEGADEDAIILADAVVAVAERLASSSPLECLLCRDAASRPGLIGTLKRARGTRRGFVIVICKPCAAVAPADKLRDAVLERLGVEEIAMSTWAS
jgi:hypothetical protein